MIDDTQLYLYFVRLVVLVERKNPTGPEEAARWCRAAVEDYQEPIPGARLKQEAEALLSALT